MRYVKSEVCFKPSDCRARLKWTLTSKSRWSTRTHPSSTGAAGTTSLWQAGLGSAARSCRGFHGNTWKVPWEPSRVCRRSKGPMLAWHGSSTCSPSSHTATPTDSYKSTPTWGWARGRWGLEEKIFFRDDSYDKSTPTWQSIIRSKSSILGFWCHVSKSTP